jgi:23S rRNA (pseudouridine1915-N3)-methyltransferase
MRIGLFAVGRLKTGPEKDLAARYLDRFAKAGPAIGLELMRLTEVAESRASNGETRKREEAALLQKAHPEGGVPSCSTNAARRLIAKPSPPCSERSAIRASAT